MHKTLPYGRPEEIEKQRALAYMALSPTEKYNSLMRLIKAAYAIRMSNESINRAKDQLDIEEMEKVRKWSEEK
jgi:hypothetical protein